MLRVSLLRAMVPGLMLLTAPSGIAQVPAQNDGPDTLRTSSTLIVVPTLVQTGAKDVVYTLTAPDFVVTDNGAVQQVRVEPNAAQPLSLVVLVQTGGAASLELGNYAHLETMLAELLDAAPQIPGRITGPQARHQVAIVNFDSKPEAASPFTSDVAEWTDAINHPEAGDSGAAVLDALAYGLRLLSSQPVNHRRAILLLSQPTDVGSKASLQEILRTAGETNTAVYALTFWPEKAALKEALQVKPHLNPPKDFGAGPFQGYFDFSMPLAMLLSTMKKNVPGSIAALTGGETATFGDRRSLETDLATLTTHIRNRYLLTFQPATPQPGVHRLEVRVPAHPEFSVSARSSYFVEEPEIQLGR